MPATLPEHLEAEIIVQPGAVVTHAWFARRGIDRSRVRRWVDGGLLLRPLPGVLTLPDVWCPDRDQHVAVAFVGRCGTGPVAITGRDAVGHHGFEIGPADKPLVAVPHGMSRRADEDDRPFRTVRHRDLGRVVHLGDRLPCTDLGLAIADVTTDRPAIDDDDLALLLHRVRNRCRDFPVELSTRWATLRTADVARLRRLVDAGALDHESPAEWRLCRAFARRGPAPDCQVWVTPHVRVDFAFLHAGLVIEYLGEQAHAGRVDADAVRTHRLRTLGAEVIAVTRTMARDLDGLVAHIHEVRRRREDLVARGLATSLSVPPQGPRRLPLRTDRR